MIMHLIFEHPIIFEKTLAPLAKREFFLFYFQLKEWRRVVKGTTFYLSVNPHLRRVWNTFEEFVFISPQVRKNMWKRDELVEGTSKNFPIA